MLVEMNVQDYLLCRRALEITSLLERYFACWSVILLAGALFCLLERYFACCP
jgi:hypothetical protein